MKIIVSTCDKYRHLLGGFAWCWNRYWGCPVDVVGFKPCDNLPPNFTFHSMAPREEHAWSTHIHDWLESIADDRVLFLFDDYWLCKPIAVERVRWMDEQVVLGADKGDLSNNTFGFPHIELTPDTVIARQDAPYRASTQPAIWRREHLLRLMRPGQSPWQFEMQGEAANDGARVIGPTTPIISMGNQYANVYLKGDWHCFMVEKIKPADRAELIEAGHLPEKYR